MWAVRTGDWRYIAYNDGDCELYDLRSDPDEKRNVADDHPDVCARLSAVLTAHREDCPYDADLDDTPQDVDEQVLERLRSLGYID
jgi:arylsulfatase A-like enzyme